MDRLKPLDRLSRLDGLERLSNPLGEYAPKLPVLPDLGAGEDSEGQLTEADEIARQVGSERLAKEIIKLLSFHPNATLPELIALEWLNRNGVSYEYQVPLFGGRAKRGGVVLDLIVNYGVGRSYGWRIQGEVIHSLRGRPEIDAFQEAALIGSNVNGTTITDVLDIYDTRLLDPNRREEALNMALAGIELGP